MEIYRIFCFLVVLIIHALRLVRGALLKMASRCWNYFLTSYIFFLVYSYLYLHFDSFRHFSYSCQWFIWLEIRRERECASMNLFLFLRTASQEVLCARKYIGSSPYSFSHFKPIHFFSSRRTRWSHFTSILFPSLIRRLAFFCCREGRTLLLFGPVLG